MQCLSARQHCVSCILSDNGTRVLPSGRWRSLGRSSGLGPSPYRECHVDPCRVPLRGVVRHASVLLPADSRARGAPGPCSPPDPFLTAILRAKCLVVLTLGDDRLHAPHGRVNNCGCARRCAPLRSRQQLALAHRVSASTRVTPWAEAASAQLRPRRSVIRRVWRRRGRGGIGRWRRCDRRH